MTPDYSQAEMVSAALISVTVSVSELVRGVRNHRFSSLYWLALIGIFSGPALLDVVLGMDIAPARLMLVRSGLGPAIVFAAAHIAVTSVVYRAVMPRGSLAALAKDWEPVSRRLWLDNSKSAVAVFAATFIVSSTVILVRRRDLNRTFNDFLDGIGPEYELYFLMASSALVSILMKRGRQGRHMAIVVALSSVVVSYFIGVRYFMFPFVGFVVWTSILNSRTQLSGKLMALCGAATIAWVGLTFWGLARSLKVRANPQAVFQLMTAETITDALKVGNELPARLAFYDIASRWAVTGEHRGWPALQATVLSAIYPSVLRQLGVRPPLSNQVHLYEIETGRRATGVSITPTVFGNDLLTWGFWGVLIGGGAMGAILAGVDAMQQRDGLSWRLLAPLATFQLIYFGRVGTDGCLGTWGRFVPIVCGLLFISWLGERGTAPTVAVRHAGTAYGVTGRTVTRRTPCRFIRSGVSDGLPAWRTSGQCGSIGRRFSAWRCGHRDSWTAKLCRRWIPYV